LEGQATIAIATFASLLLGLSGIGRMVRIVTGLIGATVPDEPGLGIAWGGVATDFSAGQGVTVTASAPIPFGGARSWLLESGRLVATGLDGGATHPGSGIVDHAIRTEEGLLPGFRAEETGLSDQSHGLGDEVVERLHGHFNTAVVVPVDHDGLSLSV